MQTTQHSSTRCQVHLHPAATNPSLIFEIRRQARDAGLPFIGTQQRRNRTSGTGPFGGDAA
ncbi:MULTISPECIES: hypothetical protein [Pseudomonas]|uniref:hypothetical protein n=1 Tax=Pseudomonadaceae TaxID=135621 RepID=UPI000428FC2F|nr:MULTISPECIES: hypothetical protein [Pseudomonas]